MGGISARTGRHLTTRVEWTMKDEAGRSKQSGSAIHVTRLGKAGTFRETVILCEVNGFRTGWLD